ncbi:DUF4870 domain-containing protein [Haloparvum sedimenti]|uniref:DUF4870 domain-containing protein n=1 Tax=Haloparvum sedimenti TaxID=1678448 RepID=UPI0009B5C329|nr:DUF4870 domain-containing protein [Haloparvum sedimenti]
MPPDDPPGSTGSDDESDPNDERTEPAPAEPDDADAEPADADAEEQQESGTEAGGPDSEGFGEAPTDDATAASAAADDATAASATTVDDTTGGAAIDSEAAASSADDTSLAAITHILALFTWVIGPVIVLVVSEDEFVRENARNAINWQIFMTIYSIIGLVLTLLVVGVFVMLLVGLLDLIFCVVAAVKANDGEAWSYPLTLDLV